MNPEWWTVVGLVLITMELLLYGIQLLWLGIAALICALIFKLVSIDEFHIQVGVYTVVAMTVLMGSAWLRRIRRPGEPKERGRFGFRTRVGRYGNVTEGIGVSPGTVKLGDTLWKAVSEDGSVIASGKAVRIVDTRDKMLVVRLKQ